MLFLIVILSICPFSRCDDGTTGSVTARTFCCGFLHCTEDCSVTENDQQQLSKKKKTGFWYENRTRTASNLQTFDSLDCPTKRG